MGPDTGKHLRNIAILLVLAALVWRIQAAAEGAAAIGNLLTIVFLSGLAFLGFRLYMENRTTLFDLDDRLRRILYGSLGLLVFTIAATRPMWDAGGVSVLLWLALIALSAFGVFHVFARWRAYD